MIPGLKVTKPKGSASSKEDLIRFESTEPIKTLEQRSGEVSKGLSTGLNKGKMWIRMRKEQKPGQGRNGGKKSLEMAGRLVVLLSGKATP